MNIVSITNALFFGVSSVLFFLFIVCVVLLIAKRERLSKGFVLLLVNFFLVVCWSFITQAYVFMPNSFFVSNILPKLLAFLIIVPVMGIFTTPYIIPKLPKFEILRNIVIFFGSILIGYTLHTLVSLSETFVVIVEDYQPKTTVDIVFLFSTGILIVLAISLFLVVTHPFRITKKKYLVNAPKFHRDVGVLSISLGFTLYLLDLIVRAYTETLWFYAIFFGLSRASIILGFVLLIVAEILHPYSLSPIPNLIRYYLENRRIGIILSCFSDLGVEVLATDNIENILDQNKPMFIESEVSTYASNTMFAFGLGNTFIEGSALLPIHFGQNNSCMSLTGWVADKEQKDPRFENKSFVQLQIIMPQEIDSLIYNRKFWEPKFTEFLKQFTARHELKNVELIKSFVYSSLIEIATRS